MYQRNMCPTLGALRRTLAADVSAAPKCSSRAFSVFARRLAEADNAAPSAPAPADPDSRKARSAKALNQITRLGTNRRIQPGGLAKGSFPSGQGDGQMPRRDPPRAPSQGDAARAEGGLKITREMVGPAQGREGARPPGPMARAPAQLKLARNTGRAGNSTAGAKRGPNLRGRDGKPGGGGGGGASGSREPGPKKRERKSGDQSTKKINPADVKIEETLSDGMVQHLLRLQRGEWDRKPYEPKYAPGSFAANELIHAGRELFRGEAPPVKTWGMLEKRIGVVGMHNAEAHLKVRRVTDPDDDALGERRQYSETGDVEIKKKVSATATAPAANAPAAVAQAAAAKPKAQVAEQAAVV
ncbi:uncharacterized protein EKO05_0002300 [Ascochyta rabiei]|uniref:Uncharacterized protein n=1 Tax=Didymella rabiei TaxID=5454 RepID=A0A163KS14_DIDRA|nr:uncharacterized protein EKO05_0002300 [Ascochyta rabiei]KZM27204.1 hypothetical protein ST47_g1614 [Ascochyta rabiei]UPX11709.1 hypothetical protein EKO05_0002300 [Ascochyta rabiei]